MKKILASILCCLALCACTNSSMTSEQKDYAKFQKDSLELCTRTPRLAVAAVEGAFDRVPENNSFWKRDKVTVNYNDSLSCWIGTVEYHVDRNNTYYKASKTFYVKYWCVGNSKKNIETFYSISDKMPVVE